MGPAAFVLAVAAALLIVLAAFTLVATYNDVVALGQRIDKAWANLEVALKQRWDELPNLVTAVRDLMRFEQQVLEEVTRLRAAYRPEAPLPEQAATAQATTAAVRTLLGVVEAYPDLSSHQNVLDLQAEIARLEDRIADRRELYNEMVYRYDRRIAQIPAVFLAGLFRWRPRPFFKAPEEAAAPPAASLETEA